MSLEFYVIFTIPARDDAYVTIKIVIGSQECTADSSLLTYGVVHCYVVSDGYHLLVSRIDDLNAQRHLRLSASDEYVVVEKHDPAVGSTFYVRCNRTSYDGIYRLSRQHAEGRGHIAGIGDAHLYFIYARPAVGTA